MEPTIQAQKRILRDVKDVMKNPLIDQGIYYIHDEDDMMRGYLMIRANDDSPFRHGFFFFTIVFPVDYPSHPPAVKFHTGDGIMRFHPNLYRNGKVCLSILNTWQGEQWSSSMSLRSVLVTLTTLFDWKCLFMEPGVKSVKLANTYDDIVCYKTYEIVLLGLLKKLGKTSDIWSSFHPFIQKYVRENRENIKKDFQEFIGAFKKKYKVDIFEHQVEPYRCVVFINTPQLENDFTTVIDSIE